MYVHDKKEDCCGCTACMTVCSVNAITMENDEEGFKYPKINEKNVFTAICVEKFVTS